MTTNHPPVRPPSSTGKPNRLADLDADIYELSEPPPGAETPDGRPDNTPWPRWQGRLAGLSPTAKLTASGTATALLLIAAIAVIRMQVSQPSDANAADNGPRARNAAPASTVDVQVEPATALPATTGSRDASNSAEPALEAAPLSNPSAALPRTTVRTVTPPAVASAPARTSGSETMVLRRVGLNYFVLRSTRDRAEADRLAERARTRGIECTVEGPLPGFTRAGWYSIVTLRGFDLPRDRDAFAAEARRLREAGQEPSPYKWR